ncbi:MAG: addiction module protein [Polyangia bacterium]|jgi:putative addiction module component (TIGR02574 family)|nr:addiction module protein [Polyangia bacterium]
MSTKRIIAEAVALPVEERAVIADCLLRSLNPTAQEFDERWASEARRRLAELRSGEAKAIPGEEVFSRLWKRYP